MNEPQDRLPAELVHALGDEALEPTEQPAFLLVTTDDDGGPRISMVSAGELLVHDERTLRIALWPGTRTAGNLGRGGTALVGAVSPGSVVYVRVRPSPLVVPAELECFELTTTEVRADVHAGMPVTSGITFRTDEPEHAAAVASWRHQRALLANARRR
jgi:flavin reductase (DIM6/NTAB) family NADH-FMN oxidoreductase RutF